VIVRPVFLRRLEKKTGRTITHELPSLKLFFLSSYFFVDVEIRNAQNNYMYDVNQEKH